MPKAKEILDSFLNWINSTDGSAMPDIDQVCDDDMTPLMYAARRDDLETVKKLLAHGASSAVTNSAGQDALTIARTAGEGKVASFLRTKVLAAKEEAAIEKLRQLTFSADKRQGLREAVELLVNAIAFKCQQVADYLLKEKIGSSPEALELLAGYRVKINKPDNKLDDYIKVLKLITSCGGFVKSTDPVTALECAVIHGLPRVVHYCIDGLKVELKPEDVKVLWELLKRERDNNLYLLPTLRIEIIIGYELPAGTEPTLSHCATLMLELAAIKGDEDGFRLYSNLSYLETVSFLTIYALVWNSADDDTLAYDFLCNFELSSIDIELRAKLLLQAIAGEKHKLAEYLMIEQGVLGCMLDAGLNHSVLRVFREWPKMQTYSKQQYAEWLVHAAASSHPDHVKYFVKQLPGDDGKNLIGETRVVIAGKACTAMECAALNRRNLVLEILLNERIPIDDPASFWESLQNLRTEWCKREGLTASPAVGDCLALENQSPQKQCADWLVSLIPYSSAEILKMAFFELMLQHGDLKALEYFFNRCTNRLSEGPSAIFHAERPKFDDWFDSSSAKRLFEIGNPATSPLLRLACSTSPSAFFSLSKCAAAAFPDRLTATVQQHVLKTFLEILALTMVCCIRRRCAQTSKGGDIYPALRPELWGLVLEAVRSLLEGQSMSQQSQERGGDRSSPPAPGR